MKVFKSTEKETNFIKTLRFNIAPFFRRREVKYVRLPLSGKSENVNLNSDKYDLAVWFRV